MTIRHIILMLEACWLMIFFVPLPVLCSGNALGIVFCAILFFITFYWNDSLSFVASIFNSSLCAKIIILIAAFLIAAAVVYIFILNAKMILASKRRPPIGKPCTVIILGCRVRENRPSRMLRRRLDTALEYLNENPDSVCIASGGQGDDEKISEAEAMKSYLLDKSFDESRIYLENKSKSTYENLLFSREIIRSNSLPEIIATATDGFHQYRTHLIAKSLELDTFALSSKTEPRYDPTYRVREWLGLSAYFLSNKKFK